jgi:DNA-binding HxlR family transcriptional regulator/putative sterol carrier protein
MGVTVNGQRRYGDPCGVARSLDVVGDRWALLIIRDLLLGPKRFKDLLGGLVGANPNVVTQRLSDLTDAGVVRRRKLPAPAKVWVYELTQRGRDLEPVLLHLGRWGAHAPYQSELRVLGHDSLVLSVKAGFDPGQTAELAGEYELWIDGDVFALNVENSGLEAARGPAADPDAVIRTDAETLTAIVTGQLSVQAARAAGKLAIDGPRRAASCAAALLTLSVGRPAGRKRRAAPTTPISRSMPR